MLQLIQATDNEDLLLIKADIEFFFDPENDVTDDLSNEDKKELKQLAEEPDFDNTLSEDEFVKATARWRIK